MKELLDDDVRDNIVERRHWQVAIPGPPQSPYEGHYFTLNIGLEGYPFKAPVLRFVTPIFHRNVDSEGFVYYGGVFDHSCAMRLDKFLILLNSLLVDPEPNLAAFNAEAGDLCIKDRAAYDERARQTTLHQATTSPKFSNPGSVMLTVSGEHAQASTLSIVGTTLSGSVVAELHMDQDSPVSRLRQLFWERLIAARTKVCLRAVRLVTPSGRNLLDEEAVAVLIDASGNAARESRKRKREESQEDRNGAPDARLLPTASSST